MEEDGHKGVNCESGKKQFFLNNLKQFNFHMIQDIYKLHWNIIHESTGVT